MVFPNINNQHKIIVLTPHNAIGLIIMQECSNKNNFHLYFVEIILNSILKNRNLSFLFSESSTTDEEVIVQQSDSLSAISIVEVKPAEKHNLKELEPNKRRSCVSCLNNLLKEGDRKYAIDKATKTRWKCYQCNKFYCLGCFSIVHDYI